MNSSQGATAEQARRELDALDALSERAAIKLYSLVQDYLEQLRHELPHQLLQAVFHLCTKLQPEAFNGMAEGQRQVMAQKYLAKVREGDRRVLLVDGEALAVLNRVPAEDEHRANMHVGAAATLVSLDADDLRICSALTESFQTLGLRFVGLDIIDGYLTEINVTSPTGVEEVLAGGGPDLCSYLMDRL